jgi:hypothetical protein
MTAQSQYGAVNPAGRLDVLLLRLAEEATRKILEPAAARLAQQPVRLWDEVRPIFEREVKRLGIPARPVTIHDVLALGAPGQRRRRCTR